MYKLLIILLCFNQRYVLPIIDRVRIDNRQSLYLISCLNITIHIANIVLKQIVCHLFGSKYTQKNM